MIGRRKFIAGLGGAAAWPVVARGQQTAVPVIGFLGTQSADEYKNAGIPFLQGLKETGYVEGQNVAIEYRWAENQYDRLPALAADLVRRRVAVIVAIGTTAAVPAKAATTTIPIVFVGGGDPVARGLVAGLNRPSANLTGFSTFTAELSPKRLQLLRELMPKVVRFGVLADPASPNSQSVIADLQLGARNLGLQLVIVSARTDSDLETAFATFSQQHVGGVLVGTGTFFSQQMDQLTALAARHALPAIYTYSDYALAGGLMSYGSSLSYLYHQTGIVIQGAESSSPGSGVQWRGRWWRGRSSQTECGASACSWDSTKTILRGNFDTLHSRERLRTWAGPMAATCGSTFVGAAMTSLGCERSRGSWSACNPTCKREPGNRCPTARNADDSDRLCGRGRSHRQRYRRAARPPRWKHHRLCHHGSFPGG
jgi:putative ABC transport system substrate-binding protein